MTRASHVIVPRSSVVLACALPADGPCRGRSTPVCASSYVHRGPTGSSDEALGHAWRDPVDSGRRRTRGRRPPSRIEVAGATAMTPNAAASNEPATNAPDAVVKSQQRLTDRAERRRMNRTMIETEVTLTSESNFFAGISGDVSQGGV